MSTKISHSLELNEKIYKLLQESEDENIEVPAHFTALIRREANRQKREREAEEAKQVIQEASPEQASWELEDIPEGFEVFDEED